MAQQETAHQNNVSVQQAEEPTQSATAHGEDRETQIRKLHNDESVCQAEEGSTSTQMIDREDRDGQIREMQQEKEERDEQIRDLQQNLLNESRSSDRRLFQNAASPFERRQAAVLYKSVVPLA